MYLQLVIENYSSISITKSKKRCYLKGFNQPQINGHYFQLDIYCVCSIWRKCYISFLSIVVLKNLNILFITHIFTHLHRAPSVYLFQILWGTRHTTLGQMPSSQNICMFKCTCVGLVWMSMMHLIINRYNTQPQLLRSIVKLQLNGCDVSVA